MSALSSRARSAIAEDATFLEQQASLELHRSNLLRLSVDQLVKECQLDLTSPKWKSASEYCSLISSLIEKIPSLIKAQKVPIYEESQDVLPLELTDRLKVQHDILETPANQGLMNRSGNANMLPTIQLTLSIPNSLYVTKDYLRNRYFQKRNAVVWHVALHLTQKKLRKRVGQVSCRLHRNDSRRPNLLLEPPNPSKFRVLLVFQMESIQWIPRVRLLPNRSNLRTDSPTPNYNHAIMEDAPEWETNSEDLFANTSSTHSALILLQVWCLQRGLLRGHDTFSTTQLQILLLFLYRTRRINSRMSSLQILSAVWKCLVETKTHDDVLVLPCSVHEPATQEMAKLYPSNRLKSTDPETLEEYYQSHWDGPVLLDPTMTFNYFARLSPSFVELAVHHAQTTLQCLLLQQAFSKVFMTTARFWESMDAHIHIPLETLGDTFELVSRKLVRLLRRALGDRVRIVRVLTTGNGSVHSEDSDQIPTFVIRGKQIQDTWSKHASPVGTSSLVLGLKLNREACSRPVDRGPPAEDTDATRDFLELWGGKAQLRRFKDGAIVHAVVWSTPSEGEDHVRFQNGDLVQGGVVERIIRHILQLHFFQTTKKTAPVAFSLRDIMSVVDGVASENTAASPGQSLFSNPTASHRGIAKAFDALSSFLRTNSAPAVTVPGALGKKQSKLGIPLPIDAVEPLSPSLRYSELFPQVPHPLLGGKSIAGSKKFSAVITSEPVHIQIRFGISSKWPTDLKAMGAAKTAMLIQLADGIESTIMQGEGDGFDGPITVTPSYLDLGYMGYSFRVKVRADPELRMIQGLHNPSPEALVLQRKLTQENVLSAMHHSTLHGIHTTHPSSGFVVRMAKRWLAGHMLSGLIPIEAVELIVAKVYTDEGSPLDSPGTVVAGFLGFLRLLATHDWAREPLIVNPHGHIDDSEYGLIAAQFEKVRGPRYDLGPPMYIISPNDRPRTDDHNSGQTGSKGDCGVWRTSFTTTSPEWVVLTRAAALAKRAYHLLMEQSQVPEQSDEWSSVFHEASASFRSYSVLMRINPDFVFDIESSSTGTNLGVRSKEGYQESSYSRSMRARFLGPKSLRRKVYRNLQSEPVLYDWRPLHYLTEMVREKFGSLCIVFYNELAPEVFALLWRPDFSTHRAFSVMTSEYARPMEQDGWKHDSLMTHNTRDVLREIYQYAEDMVLDIKVFGEPVPQATQKRKRSETDSDGSSSEDESDD